MNSDNYSAPVIAELQDKKEEIAPVVTEEKTVIAAVAPTVDLTSNQNFWRTQVDAYFRYLNGEIGFATEDKRLTETVGFIQQTGKMLRYTYPEMEDCVLYLIQKMRNNPKAIDDGRFFRFMKGCEHKYPIDAIGQFRIFATWCISIAYAWPTRVKRADKTDIESMTKNMPEDARQNLNFFVRKMANFAIN